MNMNWISSEGGPLILVEDNCLNEWQGIDSDDYDRACAIDDYAGIIAVSSSQALVFGDEPCRTAIYYSDSLGAIVVRWQWAKDEGSVQDYLNSLTETVFDDLDEKLGFLVKHGKFKLFDASSSRSDSLGITVSLEEKNYIVQTVCYEPDDQTSLILHRFS